MPMIFLLFYKLPFKFLKINNIKNKQKKIFKLINQPINKSINQSI